MDERQKEIATTIIDQIGGFAALQVMCGVRHYFALASGVEFRFKGSRKANACRVTLTADDLYTFELFRVTAKGRTAVFSEEGLYHDMLKPTFEEQTGLTLSVPRVFRKR